MSKTKYIFISHAWRYNEDYYTITQWLNESGLDCKNFSVPKHDPLLVNNNTALKVKLLDQMRPANIIIIIAGMYAAHSQWIDFEIEQAIRMNKTIIAIRPRGQERMPRIITDNATRIVNWNSNSLITAIKDCNI